MNHKSLKNVESLKPELSLEEMNRLIESYCAGSLFTERERIISTVFNPEYKVKDKFRLLSARIILLATIFNIDLGSKYKSYLKRLLSIDDFDSKVKKGDTGVVDKAANGSNKLFELTSLYCSCISPNKYPLFSKSIYEYIRELNKKKKFIPNMNKKFDGKYLSYKKIVAKTLKAYGLPNDLMNGSLYLWIKAEEKYKI